MRHRTAPWIGTGLFLLMLASGCSHMSNTAKGGLIGGGVGTGIGAAIGSASGNTGGGAAVGALVGTGIGMLAGNDADQQEKQQREYELQQTRAQLQEAESRPTQAPLGLTDIQQLAASTTSDDVIINQIRTTNSTFQLSAADIQWLKGNGVSDRVILEMQSRPPRAVYGPRTQTIIRQEPPVVIYHPRPRPVYVYDPFCPPPPRYGFGVVIRR